MNLYSYQELLHLWSCLLLRNLSSERSHCTFFHIRLCFRLIEDFLCISYQGFDFCLLEHLSRFAFLFYTGKSLRLCHRFLFAFDWAWCHIEFLFVWALLWDCFYLEWYFEFFHYYLNRQSLGYIFKIWLSIFYNLSGYLRLSQRYILNLSIVII